MGAGFFPHLMLGDEVARIAELEGQFGFVKNSAADLATVPKGLAGITKAHSGSNTTPWKFISLVICMMAGTASLPHVMMRYFTSPSVKSARRSVAWSLFFIFLLVLFCTNVSNTIKTFIDGSNFTYWYYW